jgi:hypothetical protein
LADGAAVGGAEDEMETEEEREERMRMEAQNSADMQVKRCIYLSQLPVRFLSDLFRDGACVGCP